MVTHEMRVLAWGLQTLRCNHTQVLILSASPSRAATAKQQCDVQCRAINHGMSSLSPILLGHAEAVYGSRYRGVLVGIPWRKPDMPGCYKCSERYHAPTLYTLCPHRCLSLILCPR